MKDKQKAALFMIIAALCYAVIAAIVKSIEDIPVFEKLFFRNAFGLIFILGFTIKRKISIKGVNIIGLVSRGVTGFIAASFYYLALTNIHLADSVTISNLYPFFVVIFSAIFIKEKIRVYHIIALTASFLGAVLIIRPGFTDLNYYYIGALLSAAFMGITYTILKHVRETDSSEVIIIYFYSIAIMGCIPFMIFGHFTVPNLLQLVRLISLGLVGTLYQWFMTSAYKYAPAGEVSIYSYSSIVFSSLFGVIFWEEYPEVMTIIGMVSIIFGAYIIFKKDKHEVIDV